MSSKKIKLLLVGSVGDKLTVLHRKLTSLNESKAGPFDLCIAVGSFELRNDDGTQEDFPLPVYVQRVNSVEKDATTTIDDQGIAPVGSIKNLYHLHGKMDEDIDRVHMFEISVKGHDDPLLIGSCPQHVRATEDKNGITKQQQCDILLSWDWPQGLQDVLLVDTEPMSYDVAQVALRCRPRYHVCPSTKLFNASPPYDMPDSDHVCRFLALAPVSSEKKPPKTAKFIHALGLEPLRSNPPPTTAPSTLPCPFLTKSLPSQSKSSLLPTYAKQHNMNQGDGYSRFAKSNKRPRKQVNDDEGDSRMSLLEPPEDPNASTLFLYGLHKDVTGELQSTKSPKVLQAFSKYHCTLVRHPPNAITSTYCYLEFPSQKEALECIMDCQGKITIDHVDLTLKWATQRKPMQQQNKKPRFEPNRHYVTQEDAKDSTSLYFHPPKQKEFDTNTAKNDNSSAVVDPEPTPMEEGFAEMLRQYIEKTLEDALNDGAGEDDDRVTAETEPALKVDVRSKESFGFLEFASHAAATMALAAVTNSTDGGLIRSAPDGAPAPPAKLVGASLRWAKGTPPQDKKKGDREEVLEALGLKRKFYPADSRTDCWFCLASPSCETHLITGVYNEWYATMPKGPVHPGHVLLVPVTHTREGAWSLNDEWVKLVEMLKSHATKVYDMDLFIFERSMETKGGYHTHVQCVPVPRDCVIKLQTTMLAHAKASGFELRPIQSDLGVNAILSKDDSYFYAEIRTSSQSFRFLYRRDNAQDDNNAGNVPLQFAREVLASVLKNPKLAHWKACVLDKEQETELAVRFRNSLNATVSKDIEC